MKVLLDTCVWSGAADELTNAGHDVVWAGEWPSDPGDEEILALAYRQGRILVTLDKDFGDLIFAQHRTHGGVVRLVGFRARQQGPACVVILEKYAAELAAGAFVTVEPGRVRVRAVEP